MGTISTLLADHVGFRCRSVDRIGIRGYISGLMYEAGLAKFLVGRGNPIPSPAVLTRNRDRMVAELDALVARTGVEVVRFKSGQSKEDTARPYQDEAATAGRFGLVLVGKAQEQRARGGVGWTTAIPPTGRGILISPGDANRRSLITGISISPMSSGGRRCCECAVTPLTRCGSTRTATSGRKCNLPGRGWASRRWITGCARWMTRRWPIRSAPDWERAMSGTCWLG